ncbi:MAG: bifunctional glutamate N-acetyltransferase/amino-acid acetyltransferase ArgJ [Lachnospiraceae bacterium]|nr:bifunctional glutamate N-acetyltransferase/amino-acid acetyltransferase ArgJ [Lachnospiraceae bacterium]
MSYQIIDGGVTAAKGFQAAGVPAGIKYQNRPDMAMVYSQKPCIAVGTFTSNVVKAAPVQWDMRLLKEKKAIHAIIANSGIANASTGKPGMEACLETAACAAKLLQIDQDSVLLGSTGVIGMQLPVDRLRAGVSALVSSLDTGRQAANDAERAIMTTDTVPKEVAVTLTLSGKQVTIGGMSKGSGMIHPDMCTMLAYITTDVRMNRELLDELVKKDILDTFNMISVDGDTSTNDTYLVLANGEAENPEITEKNADYEAFAEALHYVNETLAKKMAKDGEGAHALYEAKVIGAAGKAEARKLARSMVSSSLCKAAIFGHDANFGRFLCALGYAGVPFDPEHMALYFESRAGKLLIYEDGLQASYEEEEAERILSEDEVTIIADMKQGDGKACAWGCDLSYDYVKINADYRS